ncbi:leucine-rich repeat flightless-interacting protein 1 isoform X5 [Acanthochromis polyacanthus]|uniref:leucine-rich repeat flightless-interacting protein 1 isoform X5 n=1 Tax=Acanthochromis polyacanthus TaxID=80966 RepID=UPI00223498F0|nr:leucine-rich repeat flightless-interacting protein 1 isoform X5 [Acanthochromis polyacanthus]
MGTQGTGRKRSTKKERSTAEDDALNLIAREAEARLAAKRAARAEAREIRMKELERQQKEIFQVQKKYYGLNTKIDDRMDSKWGDIEQWMEDSERYSRSSRIQTLSDEDERMSVGSRGSVRVEDRDYLEKGSRAASALTAGTLTSLGGTSSRRGSGETALTVDVESSIREIKEIHELKDQIQDVETKYTQNLKEAKDALAEVEEKYRKAMVSNAQLDNEKNNLMYQVDTLKDSLMELEELLSESRREYDEKVKEYEREKHAHGVLQFQFNEMKETLKQSEELLNKHGIVLGPDLNINGDAGDSEVDGSPTADPASGSAQDSQTSPTEGNSMLGNTEETELRSSREEEVDPEQQQEMLQEVKENHLSSEIDSLNSTLCSVADVDTSSDKQPSEEQQAILPTEEDGIRQSGLSKDLTVDINDSPTTEAKDVIICSSEPKHVYPVTSPGENVSETEISEGENLKETRYSDLGETETKNNSVDTHSDVRDTCTSLHEKQDNQQEGVEESDLSNTEPCPQQKVAQDVMKESVTDESVLALTNSEPQQGPENADEADNVEAEETPSKSASGKKKKKRRKEKRKEGLRIPRTNKKM